MSGRSSSRIRRRVSSAALAGLALACKPAPQAAPPKEPVKVAAAADLALAFKDLGTAYERTTGQPVVFSFGSTGLLAKQITEGAPFDVFAAANLSFVDEVVKAGRCDKATQTLYARGRIVVWWPEGSAVAPPKTLADLADPRFVKIAIANPEHAPYGRAAESALKAAGVLDLVKPRLVFGENVQQTLQFAQTGNAELAIVALSLSIATPGGKSLPIDPALYPAIDQALVVCGEGPRAESGRAFMKLVSSEAGRAIMRRYGFLLPGEELSAAP